MTRKRSKFLPLSFLFVLLIGFPVAAQNTVAPGYDRNMPPPGPYEAKLDGILATYDSNTLLQATIFDAKDANTAVRALNWLRAKQFAAGGSTEIAMVYSAALWRYAASVPEAYKAGLQQNAAMQLLLARILISSEGFQCADGSAPSARRSVIDRYLIVVDKYISIQPDTERKREMSVALQAALVGFRLRDNDVKLCNGGAGYYVKYFQKHPNEEGKEVTVPGAIGKTKVLPADPSVLPDFVPYQSWKDKRHAALDAVVKLTGDQKLISYRDDTYRMK